MRFESVFSASPTRCLFLASIRLTEVRLRITTQSIGVRCGLGLPLAAVPNHFAVDRGAHDIGAIGVDVAEQVEIDKAVIERRDQGIGAGMRQA